MMFVSLSTFLLISVRVNIELDIFCLDYLYTEKVMQERNRYFQK